MLLNNEAFCSFKQTVGEYTYRRTTKVTPNFLIIRTFKMYLLKLIAQENFKQNGKFLFTARDCEVDFWKPITDAYPNFDEINWDVDDVIDLPLVNAKNKIIQNVRVALRELVKENYIEIVRNKSVITVIRKRYNKKTKIAEKNPVKTEKKPRKDSAKSEFTDMKKRMKWDPEYVDEQRRLNEQKQLNKN
jgi:hypothetical protein